ncbi:MAG: Gfo/Idh/MocA family oxidoreductase [Hyphomicrobiales bacterium]|nr:Gfo/Idh/MocA family oxidoreductase [Hyphomicrobiales bacterium]
MRFGLIGYGAWGRFHARAHRNAPGGELVAITSGSEANRAEARRDHPDVKVHDSAAELLADPNVEAVDIVVANSMHADLGVAALEAGKHVLMEKPMATTAAECDRLIAAARRSGRVLSIAHDYRTSKQYVRIKELLDQGALGDPMYININLFRNQFRDGSHNWRMNAATVGSWILEEPVHFMDLILWYMEGYGDPVSVFAVGNSKDREFGLFDNFACTVRFAGGALAVISQSLAGFQHHTQVQVVGREGAARTFWSGAMDRAENPTIGFQVRTRDLVFERGVTECETVEFAADSEGFKLQNQINRVVKAFARGEAPTPGEEARKRVVLSNEALRSIREGREVELSF